MLSIRMTISVRENWVERFEELPRSLAGAKVGLTEYQLITNCVHMLMGVESEFFRTFHKLDQVTIVVDVTSLSTRRSSHMSQGAIRNVLKYMAACGSTVNTVRQLSKKRDTFTNQFLALRAASEIEKLDSWFQTILDGEFDVCSLICLRDHLVERTRDVSSVLRFSKLVASIDQEHLLHILQVWHVVGMDAFSQIMICEYLESLEERFVKAIRGQCGPEETADLANIASHVDEWKNVHDVLTAQYDASSLNETSFQDRIESNELLLHPFAKLGLVGYAEAVSRHEVEKFIDATKFMDIAELVNKILFTCQSDFIISFMSQASLELRKAREAVSIHRVQDSSDVALQLSPEISRYAADVVNQFRIIISHDGAKGWDALRFRVSSNLFPVEVLRQMNHIHKFLLRLRKVEWELACVFSDLKGAGDVPKEIFAARSHMAAYVHDINRTVFHDVIDANWATFKATQYRSISHLNTSYEIYVDHVDRAVRELHDSSSAALDITEKFVEQLEKAPMNKARAVGFILALQDKQKVKIIH